jgi:hypothetical protein
MINSGRVELLDDARMLAQLVGLERRVTRGAGKDIIDHAPGAHDDLINCAAGALVLTVCGRRGCAVATREPGRGAGAAAVRADLCDIGDRQIRAGGICWFARVPVLGGVCLLDVQRELLSPGLLLGVIERCAELSVACGARYDTALFCSGAELVAALERQGFRAEDISTVTRDPTLAVSAAAHISAQRVRLCEGVLRKDMPLSFLRARFRLRTTYCSFLFCLAWRWRWTWGVCWRETRCAFVQCAYAGGEVSHADIDAGTATKK